MECLIQEAKLLCSICKPDTVKILRPNPSFPAEMCECDKCSRSITPSILLLKRNKETAGYWKVSMWQAEKFVKWGERHVPEMRRTYV